MEKLDWVNFYLKFRGPDWTTFGKINGLTFVHNLLSISGKLTLQPFIEDDIIAIYNGELYNSHSYDSDGYLLIPSYKKWGSCFTQNFDGEFAVVLVDFSQNKVVISTDLFRTKPLWIAFDDKHWGICTYRTPLERLGFSNVTKIPPNIIWEMDLTTRDIKSVAPVYTWDLVQHKQHLNHWTAAFSQSISKRVTKTRENIFIGLSSGYDSGAIACELDLQKIEYSSITVVGKEQIDIVEQRARKNHFWIKPTVDVWQHAHDLIVQKVEPYNYTICSSSSDYNEFGLSLHDDSGSNGLSMVCNLAQQQGYKIYLSGMGADEIFSDYGFAGTKIYPHSNFGGLFPDDLTTMFPWNSFYGSSMESYLAKEEYVAGAYGIEARYPYLDRDVVQEFLWLTPELKNSKYKSVLHNYLMNNKYPFVPNKKIGF